MRYQSVHVIMASYNPSSFIHQQVSSILAQDSVNVRLSIFDDGSTAQDHLRLVAELDDERISYVVGTPTGSAGLNFLRSVRLINDSCSDWFAFSDQDDVWMINKLFEGINLAQSEGAAGYSSNLDLFDGLNAYGILKKSDRKVQFDHYFQGASAGCTYILRADLFKELQGAISKLNLESAPNHLSHDWMIYYIARKAGYKWVHDSRSFIYYRQHAENVYGAKAGFAGFLSKLRLFFDGLFDANASVIELLSGDSCDADPILSRRTFLDRLRFVRYGLSLRRERHLALVFYVMWCLGYIYRKGYKFMR